MDRVVVVPPFFFSFFSFFFSFGFFLDGRPLHFLDTGPSRGTKRSPMRNLLPEAEFIGRKIAVTFSLFRREIDVYTVRQIRKAFISVRPISISKIYLSTERDY
jgi:hypothetical protein